MLQFTTVLKICRNLPLFGYSSVAKSSFPWYLSLWNSSTIKNFQNFSKYIFSKNSGSVWYGNSNKCFQFLNNITRIFNYRYFHTYFQNNDILLIFSKNNGSGPFLQVRYGIGCFVLLLRGHFESYYIVYIYICLEQIVIWLGMGSKRPIM